MDSGNLAAGGARGNLYGLEREALEQRIEGYGAPRFHARQIYRWLYSRHALDPEAWTDLPRSLRHRLGEDARIEGGSIAGRVEAGDGTIKYRVGLADGLAVESVYMVQAGRITLCVSSQVGCALACDFCLTGTMGLRRHLESGEILGQVRLILEDRRLSDGPWNIVFMGMGEPLHNYDAVLAAFRILTDEEGFGLSRRRITLSTSGLAPEIERLAGEPAGPRLAVSLNATTDAVRDRLMPINRRYPIPRLLEACRHHAASTGQRLTFEYVLLDGVNDTAADLARLAGIVKGVRAKLNLIPFNPVESWLDYRPPPRARVLRMRDELLAAGVPVSVRWSRGADARAACGQLALLDGVPERRSGRNAS